jgi:hypothetical protein
MNVIPKVVPMFGKVQMGVEQDSMKKVNSVGFVSQEENSDNKETRLGFSDFKRA